MTQFKILVEGYAKAGDREDNFFASPSSILLDSNRQKILVDPGADKEKLLNSLEKENINIEDIKLIYITHWHPDHILNIRLFPNAMIMDSEIMWKDNGEELFLSDEYISGTEIKILKTPGHTLDHTSLLIETADLGKVCIAQDVFWWEDGLQKDNPTLEELINHEDPFMADFELLKKSRRLVMEQSDWIIPGHGKMFKSIK